MSTDSHYSSAPTPVATGVANPVTQARPWLAGVLFHHQSVVLPRFAACYHHLARLPRRARRSLQRRLALTVAGAALLMALTQSPLPALGNNIGVDNGAVVVAADGKCSLREAILNANTSGAHKDCEPGNPGADTIVLPAGGVFNIPNTFEYAYNHFTGLPIITSDITLMGNGATIRRQAGAASFNLISVKPSGRLTAQKLKLEGGESKGSSGGAIFSRGDLIIHDSAIRLNRGSAIMATGSLVEIRRSTISNNSGNSAVHISPDQFILSDSVISGNDGGHDRSGGLSFVGDGTATISGTLFSGNTTSRGQGAALYVSGIAFVSNATVNITNSRFVNNHNEYMSGGAIAIEHADAALVQTTISGNTAGGNGGGLYMEESNVTIRQSTIYNNLAARGGGLFARTRYSGHLTVDNSTFSGNTAYYSGAYSNFEGSGGGLSVYDVGLTMTNSTVVGNRAETIGGGIWSSSHGLLGDTPITIARSLISGNTATDGSQIYTYTNNLTFTLDFNILGADADGGLVGLTPGPNDVVPPSGVIAEDIFTPQLIAQGGSTLTHAVFPGSLAVDAAPSAACSGQTDQRGRARNFDGDASPSANECDIGAFEWSNDPMFDHALMLPLSLR